jgi:hypothetical protein
MRSSLTIHVGFPLDGLFAPTNKASMEETGIFEYPDLRGLCYLPLNRTSFRTIHLPISRLPRPDCPDGRRAANTEHHSTLCAIVRGKRARAGEKASRPCRTSESLRCGVSCHRYRCSFKGEALAGEIIPAAMPSVLARSILS